MKAFFFLVSLLFTTLTSSLSFAAAEPLANQPINEAQARAVLQAEKSPSELMTSLTKSNAELNKKNALLEQDNKALMTQVNVLTAERSNQLFMTGAFVALGGIFLGFIAAWLLLGRRQNNW